MSVRKPELPRMLIFFYLVLFNIVQFSNSPCNATASEKGTDCTAGISNGVYSTKSASRYLWKDRFLLKEFWGKIASFFLSILGNILHLGGAFFFRRLEKIRIYWQNIQYRWGSDIKCVTMVTMVCHCVMVSWCQWIPVVHECEPGICYTQSECQEKAGTQSGPCAAGFGVCCLCK